MVGQARNGSLSARLTFSFIGPRGLSYRVPRGEPKKKEANSRGAMDGEGGRKRMKRTLDQRDVTLTRTDKDFSNPRKGLLMRQSQCDVEEKGEKSKRLQLR